MKSQRRGGKWGVWILFVVMLLISAVIGLGGEALGYWSFFDSDQDPKPALQSGGLGDAYTVSLKGREVSLDHPAHIVDGVVMLPMRDILEADGYTVRFHTYEKKAVATGERGRTVVRLGRRHARLADEVHRMSHDSVVIEGALYIPVDFVEEVVGGEVSARAGQAPG